MKIKKALRHSGKRFLLIRNPVISIAYWMSGQVRHDNIKSTGQQWRNSNVILTHEELAPSSGEL